MTKDERIQQLEAALDARTRELEELRAEKESDAWRETAQDFGADMMAEQLLGAADDGSRFSNGSANALLDRLARAEAQRDYMTREALHLPAMQARIETLEQENQRLTRERAGLRDLLERIRGWDMMDDDASDGAYWRREIDAALAPALATPEAADGIDCAENGCRLLRNALAPPAATPPETE